MLVFFVSYLPIFSSIEFNFDFASNSIEACLLIFFALKIIEQVVNPTENGMLNGTIEVPTIPKQAFDNLVYLSKNSGITTLGYKL